MCGWDRCAMKNIAPHPPCSLDELLCELFFQSSEDLSASDMDRGTVYVCVHVFVRV